MTADGAAFRSKGRWYGLQFTCDLSADGQSVTGFAFLVGDAIPREKWDAFGLAAVYSGPEKSGPTDDASGRHFHAADRVRDLAESSDQIRAAGLGEKQPVDAMMQRFIWMFAWLIRQH